MGAGLEPALRHLTRILLLRDSRLVYNLMISFGGIHESVGASFNSGYLNLVFPDGYLFPRTAATFEANLYVARHLVKKGADADRDQRSCGGGG